MATLMTHGGLRRIGSSGVPIRLFKRSGTGAYFGAARARGDVLFFVDADVMVPPDAIERVLGYFTREPEMDALWVL